MVVFHEGGDVVPVVDAAATANQVEPGARIVHQQRPALDFDLVDAAPVDRPREVGGHGEIGKRQPRFELLEKEARHAGGLAVAPARGSAGEGDVA